VICRPTINIDRLACRFIFLSIKLGAARSNVPGTQYWDVSRTSSTQCSPLGATTVTSSSEGRANTHSKTKTHKKARLVKQVLLIYSRLSVCTMLVALISVTHSESRTPAGRKKSFSSHRKVRLWETFQLFDETRLAVPVFLVSERVCVPKCHLLLAVVLQWGPLVVCSSSVVGLRLVSAHVAKAVG
jgi:hypothetical protein